MLSHMAPHPGAHPAVEPHQGDCPLGLPCAGRSGGVRTQRLQTHHSCVLMLPACPAQVFIYNIMGWPLPVEPKKNDQGAELEGAAATKELPAGTGGSELRRRKTTGGVTKVASTKQWMALQQV
jgi:hypothetical protein